MSELSSKEKRLLRRILIAGLFFVLLLPIHRRELVYGWTGLSFFMAPVWDYLELPLYLIGYIIIGFSVLKTAAVNLKNGQVFDENFLMSIATVGAFALGQYAEGMAVMLFYQVGELFQSYAVNRSRRSITALMDIYPDYANLLRDGALVEVSPEEARPGDVIVIRPGERIPLDGTVLEGRSAVDTSALTGESIPRDVEAGASVISGCINLSGLLTVSVTKEFGESTVVKVLELVENASDKKSRSENFITRFARYYTPAVVYAALALAILPPLVTDLNFLLWIERALTFLVISCPCALVISVPLSFFGGIGGASKCGILVKGSNFLEQLAKAEVVVFDKTGTLTKGSFAVTEIFSPEMDEAELLALAAHAEGYSNHPIAASIRAAYGREPDSGRIGQVEEVAGRGVRAFVDGREVLAGNARLLKQEKISFAESNFPGTLVYLAADGRFAGHLLIADELKGDAKRAVADLRAAGIRETVMLTGDTDAVGQKVAADLGLDRVYTELLPADKVEKAEELLAQKSEGGTLVFVGDGINDAPVLARADVGVAMGGLGSDAAIEAADIVIMTDEPSKLATAIQIGKKTLGIVRQNIVFALSVKALFLILGALGHTNMWGAVFADVGVSVIAILNAVRALRVEGFTGEASSKEQRA